MFVVPASAGIRAKNRLKAGLSAAHFQPRAVWIAQGVLRTCPGQLSETTGKKRYTIGEVAGEPT
jgi:hypothetical protein